MPVHRLRVRLGDECRIRLRSIVLEKKPHAQPVSRCCLGRYGAGGSATARDIVHIVRWGWLFGIGSTPTNTINGYRAEDLNMDGVVKYFGMGADRDLILQTVDGSVPTAVRVEQVP